MKPATLIIGVLLIVLGVVTLAYEGFTMTTKEQEDVVDVGELEVSSATKTTVPLRPIMGGLALVGGLVLVMVSNKKS